MSQEQDLLRIIREIVKQELSQKRIKSGEMISGGDTTISSLGNINLRTGANGKIFANGVEVGTGSGSGSGLYLPLAGGEMDAGADIQFDHTGGIKFFNSSSGIQEGDIRVFNGQSAYDLLINANRGNLYLDADTSIYFNAPVSFGNIISSNVTVHKAVPAITLKDNGGGGSDIFFYDDVTQYANIHCSNPNLYIRSTSTNGKVYIGGNLNSDSLYVMDNYVNITVPLQMGGNRITTLAYATDDGDAVCLSQMMEAIVDIGGGTGVWGTITGTIGNQSDLVAALDLKLSNTAGSTDALTGDLYINKTTPSLVLAHEATVKGYVQATATEFDIYPNGVPMYLGDAGQAIEVSCTAMSLYSALFNLASMNPTESGYGQAGSMYYNSSLAKIRYKEGSTWYSLGTGVTNPLTSRLTLQANSYAGTDAYIENSATGVVTLSTKTKLRIVIA